VKYERGLLLLSLSRHVSKWIDARRLGHKMIREFQILRIRADAIGDFDRGD
jgi:hypothetical protein